MCNFQSLSTLLSVYLLKVEHSQQHLHNSSESNLSFVQYNLTKMHIKPQIVSLAAIYEEYQISYNWNSSGEQL